MLRLHQSAGDRKWLTAAAHTTADTTALTVKFAFTAYPAQLGPGVTWHTGQWIEAAKHARIRVGASALALPLGVHRVWICASTTTEDVIDLLGVIRVS